ncbi:MAG: LacI family DNA-binding transcriptional regulator [Streptosporangiaceae bacterium]|nr:LacI family DNA-binding transcriptional regulator [Streptosporangiaceae bacterium]MBV9856756.1 LacI family DNA-binding transcriptional regulator [Streptosporangiaceae bacterium]
MKDVALYAGVALKTVSRVVNGERGVTPEMAGRVRAAIEELGFRRNESARLLRTGQTASVGLIVEDTGNLRYGTLARAVEDIVRANGSLLFTGSTDNDSERERALALALCARRVDGLIIVPADADHDYLRPEIAAGVAAVFAGRPSNLAEADAVLADDEGGARDAVAHLIAHGHRRIGYLGGPPGDYLAQRLRQGYADAMAAAALPADDRWAALVPPTREQVGQAMQGLLAASVTAVFSGGSEYTALAVRTLRAAGKAGRIALVGFGDFEFADLLDPGITVVAEDPAEMGRVAAELLFRRLAGEAGPARRAEVSTRLIPRGSGELAAVLAARSALPVRSVLAALSVACAQRWLRSAS